MQHSILVTTLWSKRFGDLRTYCTAKKEKEKKKIFFLANPKKPSKRKEKVTKSIEKISKHTTYT
jgi:hypothetical protein